MGIEPNLADLLAEARQIRADLGGVLDTRDTKFAERFTGLENSINELFKKMHRPGAASSDDDGDERKLAIDYCILKHDLNAPKIEASAPVYVPSNDEITGAIQACKAIRSLWRHGNVERLDAVERKSLSSFSFGTNQFVLPAQMSSRVLSCLTDQTDLAGLMGQEQTSGGSLKFMIDNVRMQDAAWACDASCFANNPQSDLAEGLGELEIKAESLRYIACAGSDLLADAAFDIEGWIFRKAATGFRNTINQAIVGGDGINKPMGFLNPASGIIACETGERTPAGQISWQDLVALKYEVPPQWLGAGTYFMNSRTLALLLTMSDATGRPILMQLPTGLPALTIAGSPIQLVTQMPDVLPGSTPVAFGSWKDGYMLVTRSGLTMRPDPFTAGFCTLYRFEARVGGAVTCGNAIRLLRVR